MMDFRLKVFMVVARNLSFTKAAKELLISQPAISRHIRELEDNYKTQLFERSGNKVRLTPAGEIFLRYAHIIMESYTALQLEINLLTNNFIGKLHIGASTTIAQYYLPPVIARFMSLYPDIQLSVITGNSAQIEQALEEHRIDIGLIEGSHRKSTLKYVPFEKDELVLVTSVKNKVPDEITLGQLCNLPLVLRESGSGTLEVVERILASHSVRLSDLNILLQLGSTESIKLFLENSPAVFAIVSVAAVTRELLNNILKVIDITGVELEREFAIVVNQGMHNDIQERFIRFLISTL